MKKSLLHAIAVIAALMGGGLAHAAPDATYPTKAIRLIVPFAPGGGTDVIARVIGKQLAEDWGQAVVIENKAGAAGNIGARQVAAAEPDGYTILVTSTAFAINASFYKNPGYDPAAFIPIINAGYSPSILFVHPSVPVKTLQELIALGKSRPLFYASAGIGTVPFLTAEYLLNKKAGMKITHAPHSGAATAVQAVIGGHVPVGAAAFATPGLVEWFKDGKLRAIAVTSEKRTPSVPDVPTAGEQGFPGFVDNTWIAFFAPAGTPKHIIEKASTSISRIIQMPAVRETLAKIGFDWEPNTPEQFGAYMQSELAKWSRIVSETGVRAD